ncbi:imm11 family protein [Cystobacter fuscus]
MERRFFDLNIDVYVPGRWYLTDPIHLSGDEIDDIWRFSNGRPVELHERLHIPIYRPGKPLDFTTAGAGRTPILSERAASVFRALAPSDAQLFPVEVEGETEPYYLLNVARQLRCIDDAACEEVQFYTSEGVQAHRAGEYRAVSGLRIDKAKVGEARVFRLWGWHPPLIVDGEIKEALERTGIVGGRFDEV